MVPKVLASRCFGMADQLLFTELSGDHNPMHIDAIAARRTQAGAPVVHGVHAVLWALEHIVQEGLAGTDLCSIGVQFRKFMYLDQPAELALVRNDHQTIKAELSCGGLVAVTLHLRKGPRKVDDAVVADDLPPASTLANLPNAPELQELAGLSGWIGPCGPPNDLARTFPHLARALGTDNVEQLALLSRLVGMICPGLHSIFSSFAIDLVHPGPRRMGLGFKASGADPRYRLVKMAVAGRGIAGTASAFVRQPPVEAPPMRLISAAVGPRDFSGACALIVGGSRGLGAVTAKAIAAGGGRVVVTYARGREDAHKLAEEINAARRETACTILPYDSTQSAARQLADLTDEVDQLYYFATPAIFRQRSDVFDARLFRVFNSVYVDGFYDVCRFVRAQSRAQVLSVLYPSSIFVEKRPPGFTEYSMAKIAGETLCADMMQHVPGLRILVSRLPRVQTDQTAAIAQADNADPLPIMLPLLREVHRKE
jgi:NAD(P)-dependent dehydrogenase (short-subunit alcohol dehydrogenase family)/acyl dehydratase